MRFIGQPLWSTVLRELATASKIRITTYNLSLDTLKMLADKAPRAEIYVIFNADMPTPWNKQQWNTFQEEFGRRVKIRKKITAPQLHAKVLRVTGEGNFAVVGSSNLTQSGYGTNGEGNQEASVRFEDKSELRAIDQWWKQLWETSITYTYSSDDTNPFNKLAVHATRTGNRQEPDDDPDDDPRETLHTAPDDLVSLHTRIQRPHTTPRHADQFHDYQCEILSALDDQWHSDKFRELIVLPVGAGKTLIAAEFIRRRFKSTQEPLRILWVAHTLELAEQAMSAILSQLSQLQNMPRIVTWIGNAKSMIVVDDLKKHESVLAFATVQSITKLREMLPHGTKQFHFAVIDEAHHYGEGNHWREKIEGVWKVNRLLGLTATPERLDGKELPFEEILGNDTTFRSLVERRLLAYPEYQTVKTNVRITGLRPFSKKSINYFESQGIKQFDRDDRNRVIAHDLASRPDLGPTLVFCATKDHADRLAEAIRNEGFPSEQVQSIHSGHTLDERSDTLKWFRSGRGERRILLNCKLYIEGFDMPDIRTIVLARPTLSPTYWMQMIGRGVRKSESHETLTIIEYLDKYEEPNWDALRASFYLLHDRGLEWWDWLFHKAPLDDGQQIDGWNRETHKLYQVTRCKLARQSEAA